MTTSYSQYLYNLEKFPVILYMGNDYIEEFGPGETKPYIYYENGALISVGYDENYINKYIQSNILSMLYINNGGNTIIAPGYVDPGYFSE